MIGQTHGIAQLACSATTGQTCLTKLYQHNPLRVLFPEAAKQEPLTATLLTTSGGLVGGDCLDFFQWGTNASRDSYFY